MLWAQIREWNIAVRDDWQLMNFCLSLSTVYSKTLYSFVRAQIQHWHTIAIRLWEPFSAKHSTERSGRASERTSNRMSVWLLWYVCVCVWSSDWVCTYAMVFFMFVVLLMVLVCWCCYCDSVCFNTKNSLADVSVCCMHSFTTNKW